MLGIGWGALYCTDQKLQKEKVLPRPRCRFPRHCVCFAYVCCVLIAQVYVWVGPPVCCVLIAQVYVWVGPCRRSIWSTISGSALHNNTRQRMTRLHHKPAVPCFNLTIDYNPANPANLTMLTILTQPDQVPNCVGERYPSSMSTHYSVR